MQELVGQISRRSKSRIQHYSEPTPIFERYSVQKQIDDAFHRQVWLPCGGYIVIDETEALIAIDVNTGRNKGAQGRRENHLPDELEAADEMARQMRLRNIGGLIIGDFIDMKASKDQQAVYQRMKDRLKRDKAKTHVLPISQLGLMEMTRQRAAGKPQRLGLRALPLLPRTRHGEERDDDERRAPARAARRHAQVPGHHPRHQGDGASARAPAAARARTRSCSSRSSANTPGASLSASDAAFHHEQYVIADAEYGPGTEAVGGISERRASHISFTNS